MVSEDWHTEQLARRADELRTRCLLAGQAFVAAEEHAAEVFDELADRGGDRAAYRRGLAERARMEAARAGAVMSRMEHAEAIRQAGTGSR